MTGQHGPDDSGVAMAMPLRPYQEDQLLELFGLLAQETRVAFCSPTGSGKTVALSELAMKLLDAGRATRVLIAAPLRTIVDAFVSHGWPRLGGDAEEPTEDDSPEATGALADFERFLVEERGVRVTSHQQLCCLHKHRWVGQDGVKDAELSLDEGHHAGKRVYGGDEDEDDPEAEAEGEADLRNLRTVLLTSPSGGLTWAGRSSPPPRR